MTDGRQNSPRLQHKEIPSQPAAEWPTSSPRQAPRIDPSSQRMQNRGLPSLPRAEWPTSSPRGERRVVGSGSPQHSPRPQRRHVSPHHSPRATHRNRMENSYATRLPEPQNRPKANSNLGISKRVNILCVG